MIQFYFLNQNNNILLVVDKKLSFDKNLKGDFNLVKNILTKKMRMIIFIQDVKFSIKK